MTKPLYEKECIFLISVVIIHSSPMILNHGPVVISFDLEKCRRSNNCEALYSSNNINPTQLTIANIAFNAKSNKGGMIKLNTTQLNASDKEINRNQTDAMSTEKNQTENRSNLGIGAIDVEYHNVSNSEKKQNIAFNKTSDFSNENLNNFTKQNSNLTLTDKEKRMMNWHMKSNGDNDTVLDNKKEAAKFDIRNCSLKNSSDSAENRKLNLNIENQSKFYSEINSNVIDNNEQVKNKLNTTTQYMDKSKIKTDMKKTKLGKSEMLYTFKSNNDSKNNVNTTQLKATVNKYIVDAPGNKTMVLLAKKYYDKLNTHNLTSKVNKINGTNKNVSYIITTNQSINLQGIRFNNSNTKLATNIKNNQTLKGIHVNENNDTKSNYSTTQSTKGKNGHNYKVTINRTLDLINKKNQTYHAHDHLSKVNGVSNTSNDKQASDFKNQTDVYEFDVEVTEPTTQFSADEYYKNFYNETDKIRKSAIDTFIEIDKISRSKRTQELEALLSRMSHKKFTEEHVDGTPAKPGASDERDGNPPYPHPKLVFNDIYSNMFKPTMLFRNKKDGRLSNLRLNLDNFDMPTQSTLMPSSSMTPTVPFQYVGTVFLLNVKSATSTPMYSTEQVVTSKPVREEKGLLDLIFPASRVKTFKQLFNAIRRILSHTF